MTRWAGSNQTHSRGPFQSMLILNSLASGTSFCPFTPPSYIHPSQSHSPFYRDTVNSVGLIPRRLPFTTSNTIVRTFRHAVSLDERRAKFKANLWNRPKEDEKTLSVTDQHVELIKQKAGSHPSKSRLLALERQYGVKRLKDTDIDEVRWRLYQT